MRKKVLLLGYVRKNIGDDLFIAMLLNRYKELDFILRIDNEYYYEPFSKYKNCSIIVTKDDILKQDMSNISACIYVGGSIFIEYDRSVAYRKVFNQFIKNCKDNGIPFYYMSSNFGPYKTQDFYDLCEEAFSFVDGITFRDKNSYNTFKHIDNVKYVPDLVFGLGIRKGRKIKNSVGISLVDLSLPVRGEKANKIDSKYCLMLKNNIEKFIDEGKEVYLFSFCEHEGDLRTIDRILDFMGDSYQARVNIIDYTGKSGDLYYFVKLYSRMEKTICTRFHSLVMSLVFKHELMVVSYSDKLNNLLDDLGYNFDVVNIDEKIGELVINDSDFRVIDDKTLNKFKKEALRHFESLDNSLKIKRKSNKLKIKRNTLRSKIYDKLTNK